MCDSRYELRKGQELEENQCDDNIDEMETSCSSFFYKDISRIILYVSCDFD